MRFKNLSRRWNTAWIQLRSEKELHAGVHVRNKRRQLERLLRREPVIGIVFRSTQDNRDQFWELVREDDILEISCELVANKDCR